MEQSLIDQIDWRIRVFDSLSFPTLVLSRERKVIAANTVFLKRFGTSKEMIIGRSCQDEELGFINFHIKECDSERCPHHTALSTGKPHSIQVQRTNEEGKTVWEERVFSPIIGKDNSVEYVIESIRDITKVKKLEKKYSEMRELIDKVVQSSVSGIIAADRKGNIILMNEAAEKLFGYTIFDANHINIEDFYPPGVAREIMRLLRDENIGERGKLPNSKFTIVTSAGEQVPVEMTAAIIYEGNKEAATAAIFNDLREKQAFAKKLEDAEVQLVQSEKLASIGRLAAGVAHEINNPLTSILMYGSMLSEQLDPEHPLAENLKYILEDTGRCTEIVKNLLAYSRQQSPSRAVFYLNNLVNESLGLIRDQKLFMNVEVIKNFDEHQILVFADKNQLCQVIINLLMNAFDAMDGTGTLTLTTYRNTKTNRAFIEISDTGTGISAEDQLKVFEPFFTTKPLGKGTGLGLSMAYGIMQENDGNISIKKTGPEGTTILLELPEEPVTDEFHFVSIG
ncbi:PAS domain S-box protein [Desulfopila sp. IMCC35008]|uniref:PAS domain-containing sensor histidine kinase n=1 Tax=Desulfopila sp. IMCC35008 TaxID=2653858 RepID=UPI0013D56124|nr:PAS domain S-box protein [Desulfopila sp. IMCC35008]